MELTKARLVTMSVFTALCGFLLGGTAFTWSGFLITVVGVTLLGAGSGMLNHVVEIETDAKMDRTRNRPLPAGRVDVAVAERTGGLLVAAGSLMLGLWQPWAGLLAFAAFASYVLVYTPMKRQSPSCTVVGAVPGALPVLIGYVVRTGTIDLGGAILFRHPVFVAVAALYGYRLAVSGRLRTCRATDGHGHRPEGQPGLQPDLDLLPGPYPGLSGTDFRPE